MFLCNKYYTLHVVLKIFFFKLGHNADDVAETVLMNSELTL